MAAVAPHNNNTEGSSSPSLLAAAFTDGTISVYDLEATSQSTPVLTFEGCSPGRVNAIAVHPTMAVLVSAHEDRQIKLWDLNSGQSFVWSFLLIELLKVIFFCQTLGKCLHAMVAHLDEVTCLACDPNGLYLLSGSKSSLIPYLAFRASNFDNLIHSLSCFLFLRFK